MKKPVLIFVISGIMMILSSCSNYTYFTEDIRENLNTNYLKIERVQFYNSDKIILKRNLSKEETQLAQGKIIYENGKYFEEIIIPKKTKGVAVKEGSHFLNIAFETGENRNIRFDVNGDNKYQISAQKWNDNYGSIVYDTTTYYIVPASSNTLLMVSKEYVEKFESKRRVLKGRSVGK